MASALVLCIWTEVASILHGAYDADEPGHKAISVTYSYSKDHRPDMKQIVLQLITHHKSALTVSIEEVKRSLGCFIIATNDLDTERLPARAMVETYKDQGESGERGFRFLKGWTSCW